MIFAREHLRVTIGDAWPGRHQVKGVRIQTCGSGSNPCLNLPGYLPQVHARETSTARLVTCFAGPQTACFGSTRVRRMDGVNSAKKGA